MYVCFSLDELKQAIGRGKDTTSGRDGIGYQIFRHLDDTVLEEVLKLINVVWEGSILPKEWKRNNCPNIKTGEKGR